MDSEAKILKFPTGNGIDPAGQGNPTQAQGQTSQTALMQSPPEAAPPPIWMQRSFMVITVIFCLWLGLVLSVLPWLPAWTENSLVSDFPNLRWFLGTGFVRGLATGLGLLDLWIGIAEAVHYRDRR
jgi:hypothetical protein